MTKQKYSILNTSFLIGTLVGAIILVPIHLFRNGFVASEWITMIVMVFAIGTAISAGYHRLFSHRAYQASWVVRFMWLVLASASFENSALKWSSDHRIHHQHADDEEKDPYAISKGFWFAHWVWVMKSTNSNIQGVDDLKKDPLILWQHRNHFLIGGVVSLLPLLLGFIDGNVYGYLVISVLLRIVLTHHTTFLINSMAHSFGFRTYSNNQSARDNYFLAPLTYGEGFHSFHHKFQWDYRNGVRWFQWDSTKWILSILNLTGLVRSLRKATEAEIRKAKVMTQEESLANKIQRLPMPLRSELQSKLSKAYLDVVNALNQLHEIYQQRSKYRTEHAKNNRSFNQLSHDVSLGISLKKKEAKQAWRAWKQTRREVNSVAISF